MPPRHETVQQAAPVRLQLPRQQRLSLGQIVHVDEAVVALVEADPRPRQLARQPVAAVQTDVDAVRHPRLQPQVHQAELRVEQIEVEVRTLAELRLQLQPLRRAVPAHGERLARLDALEHRDQPLGHAVGPRDVQRPRLLPLATARQVNDRSPRSLGQPLGRHGDLLRPFHRPILEVHQQHPHRPQIQPQPPQTGQPPNRPAKPHPVKPRQRPLDFRRHPLEKCLHGVSPVKQIEVFHNHPQSTNGTHAFVLSLWLRLNKVKPALGVSW